MQVDYAIANRTQVEEFARRDVQIPIAVERLGDLQNIANDRVGKRLLVSPHEDLFDACERGSLVYHGFGEAILLPVGHVCEILFVPSCSPEGPPISMQIAREGKDQALEHRSLHQNLPFHEFRPCLRSIR